MGFSDIIINIVNVLVLFYLSNELGNSIILKEEYKLKRQNNVMITPSSYSKYCDIDISRISLKYRKCILNFIKVMIKNFNSYDLINLYNNINELIIEENNSIIKRGFSGIFHGKKDKIEVIDNFEKSIYHELFHMASFHKYHDTLYCGFSQRKNKIKIGDGINEGYTELLTRRYFFDSFKESYYLEIIIAEQLEKLIGFNKMQSLYLNGNLYELIEHLKKYSTKDKIMDFIRDVDFISKYRNNLWKKSTFLYRNYIINCLKKINKFLIQCYTKKLLLETNLSYNDILKNTLNYIYEFSSSLIYKNRKYEEKCELMNEQDIDDYLEDAKEIIEQFKTSHSKGV